MDEKRQMEEGLPPDTAGLDSDTTPGMPPKAPKTLTSTTVPTDLQPNSIRENLRLAATSEIISAFIVQPILLIVAMKYLTSDDRWEEFFGKWMFLAIMIGSELLVVAMMYYSAFVLKRRLARIGFVQKKTGLRTTFYILHCFMGYALMNLATWGKSCLKLDVEDGSDVRTWIYWILLLFSHWDIMIHWTLLPILLFTTNEFPEDEKANTTV